MQISHDTIALLQIAAAVITSVLASSGFWLFIDKSRAQRRQDRKLLIGLAHDRIVTLCLKYIKRGEITQEEYENLHEFLYKPYKDLGANGSALRLITEVNRLPIKIVTHLAVPENMKGENDASSG